MDKESLVKMINNVENKKFSDFSSEVKSTLNTYKDENSSYQAYAQEKEVYNSVIDNSQTVKQLDAHKSKDLDNSEEN